MKLSNNWERQNPNCHLLSPNKASSTRILLHVIALLVKEFPWEFPNKIGCCKDYKLLFINRQQGSVTKDNTHKTHWIWMCWIGAYIEPSSLCSSVFGTKKNSAHCVKRNVSTRTKTSSKPLSTMVYYLQDMLRQW